MMAAATLTLEPEVLHKEAQQGQPWAVDFGLSRIRSYQKGPHLKSSSRKRGAEAKAAAVCALRSGAQSGSTPSSRALRCVGLLASASSTASSCATRVLATAITCGMCRQVSGCVVHKDMAHSCRNPVIRSGVVASCAQTCAEQTQHIILVSILHCATPFV